MDQSIHSPLYNPQLPSYDFIIHQYLINLTLITLHFIHPNLNQSNILLND